MRIVKVCALAVLACGFLSGEAAAMCGGGGMGGGGGAAGGPGVAPGTGSSGMNRGSGNRGSSGAGVSRHGGGGGGSANSSNDSKDFQKAALPAAAEIAALDTTKFDTLVTSLSLSEAQVTKVETLKKDIKAEADKLAKTQADARTAYEKAQCELSCAATARDVVGAAANCRSYNGSQKFSLALAKILTGDQWNKYRELLMKG